MLAIFHGPHAYISPSWYEADTKEVLDRTVSKFESTQQSPWRNEIPADLEQTLLQSIIGFRIRISKIEGKFKLGQNRSEADQAGMLERLQSGSTGDRELAEFISD